VIAVVLRPVLVRPQCKPLLESGWAPSNPSDSKESRSLRTDTEGIYRLAEDEAGQSVGRQRPAPLVSVQQRISVASTFKKSRGRAFPLSPIAPLVRPSPL
jgi:hypothetical protein